MVLTAGPGSGGGWEEERKAAGQWKWKRETEGRDGGMDVRRER